MAGVLTPGGRFAPEISSPPQILRNPAACSNVFGPIPGNRSNASIKLFTAFAILTHLFYIIFPLSVY